MKFLVTISGQKRSENTLRRHQIQYIHRELSKKGVTLTLLWQEYCEAAYANVETPYISTQFGGKSNTMFLGKKYPLSETEGSDRISPITLKQSLFIYCICNDNVL